MSDDSAAQPVLTAAQADPVEQALLARLRKQDGDAFTELVNLYGGRMLAVARRILRQEQDAQDAVQDAFISAFKNLEKFQGESRLSTWLHRIAVNASLMKLRKAGRLSERPIGDLLPTFSEDGFLKGGPKRVWDVPVDQPARDAELREQIRQKIDELPEAYRTVLLMRDIEGLDTRQAADLLGITEAAAKVRLHRARQALRTLLDRTFTGNGQ